jgi:type IV secretion system protein VirD4
MRELVVAGPQAGRVLLGRLQPSSSGAKTLRRLGVDGASPALASPRCYGVLVVGAARSGKTTSILTPAVTRWDGPVIATSIRNDVLKESWEVREAAGWPVLIYNPKNQGGYGSNTWSPLVAAMGEQPWVGARRMATALIEASGLAENGANRAMDFWNAAAADFLGPLLLAAAGEGPSMEPVVRWLREGDDAKDEVRLRLARHPAALRAADSVFALAARQRDSIYLTARTALAAYQDPEVIRTCLASGPGHMPDITPETVLGTPGKRGASLYVVSPPTDWRYFAPLFTALLTSLLDAAYSRSDGSDGSDAPLLVALDEVANIAPIADLPSIVSTAAGAGIQLITVLQDLGQAERIWGKDGARTLLQNHYARLILGGTVDLDTLEWAQAMLGEREVETTTKSEAGFAGRRSTSRSYQRQPIATAAEIREMPRGTALLIAGSAPAARVTLRQGTTI